METFALWLAKPLSPRSACTLWLLCTLLVFVLWIPVPMLLGVQFRMEYFAITLSLKSVAILMSVSFGEEFVFRALPVVVVLILFPKKTAYALLASIAVAYPFGMWHEWVATAKTCLGLGGIILTLVYLKFGGASGKPFNGLLASGGIHATCNFAMIIFATVVRS